MAEDKPSVFSLFNADMTAFGMCSTSHTFQEYCNLKSLRLEAWNYFV